MCDRAEATRRTFFAFKRPFLLSGFRSVTYATRVTRQVGTELHSAPAARSAALFFSACLSLGSAASPTQTGSRGRWGKSSTAHLLCAELPSSPPHSCPPQLASHCCTAPFSWRRPFKTVFRSKASNPTREIGTASPQGVCTQTYWSRFSLFGLPRSATATRTRKQGLRAIGDPPIGVDFLFKFPGGFLTVDSCP